MDVCAVILGNSIIALVYIYLNFLEEIIITPSLQNQIDASGNIILQQDEAPPHYFAPVTVAVRCISRRGATGWPLRSPNLSPLDFFQWAI